MTAASSAPKQTAQARSAETKAIMIAVAGVSAGVLCYYLYRWHRSKAASQARTPPAAASGPSGQQRTRKATGTCVCGQPAALQCSRCKAAFYCSAACQRSDWKLHKAACATAGGHPPAKPGPAPPALRDQIMVALSQVLALREQGKYRQALQACDGAVALTRDCDFPLASLQAVYIKAHILLEMNDAREASQYFNSAVRGCQALLSSMAAAADIFPSDSPAHEHPRGVAHYVKDLVAIKASDVQCMLAECHVGLAYVGRRVGDVALSLEHAQQAADAADLIGCQELRASSASVLAMAMYHTNRRASVEVFQRALNVRLTNATADLKAGRCAPGVALAALVPSAMNLTTALTSTDDRGAAVAVYARAVLCLPFLDVRTSRQLLVAYHNAVEGAGIARGEELDWDESAIAALAPGGREGGKGTVGADDGARSAGCAHAPPGSNTVDWHHLLMACVVTQMVGGDVAAAGTMSALVRDVKALSTRSGYERAAWARAQLQQRCLQGRQLESTCPVCLADMKVARASEEGAELVLLDCCHAMHTKCWDSWLGSGAGGPGPGTGKLHGCPVCRTAVDVQAD